MKRPDVWNKLQRSRHMRKWIREHDVKGSETFFAVSATILLLLGPSLLLSAQGDQDTNQMPVKILGLIFGSGTLLILSMNIHRAFLSKSVIVETVCWLVFILSLFALGSSEALSYIGKPLTSIELSGDRYQVALAAWMTVGFSSMALLISSRGFSGYPAVHSMVVIGFILLLAVDEEVIWQHRRALVFLVLAGAFSIWVSWYRHKKAVEAYKVERAQDQHREENAAIVASLLPDAVHERFRNKERIADAFSNLTVIFADVVGFTGLSRRVSPGHLVEVLNQLFQAGDEMVASARLEKVKTIGDCYMAVSGGVNSSSSGPIEAISFALCYITRVEEISRELDIPLSLRVGIHCGPAVGGIIGESRPSYDYWGDTVNLAKRLESASSPGRILVSESIWLQTKRSFSFSDATSFEDKALGVVQSYFVLGESPVTGIGDTAAPHYPREAQG
jgi:class 3 adenylate cyclase